MCWRLRIAGLEEPALGGLEEPALGVEFERLDRAGLEEPALGVGFGI